MHSFLSLSLSHPSLPPSQSHWPPISNIISNSSLELPFTSFSFRNLATSVGPWPNFIPSFPSLRRPYRLAVISFMIFCCVLPQHHPLWLLVASGFHINVLKPSVLPVLRGQEIGGRWLVDIGRSLSIMNSWPTSWLGPREVARPPKEDG